MKKCPTCEKTFEDSMRFCQADGTPLVDDAPAFDPYATIVSSAPIIEDNAVEEVPVAADDAVEQELELEVEAESEPEPEPEPEVTAAVEPADDPSMQKTMGSVPIAPPDDVLDLPGTDPLKTMYVSESEMKEALGGAAETEEGDLVELQPLGEMPEPEPPAFIATEVPAPGGDDVAPPPSPFSMPEPVSEPPVTLDADVEPEPLAFDEMATMIQPTFESPPAPPPPAPVAEWTPPPAADDAWQNQEIATNTPFQPPSAGAAGQNKTLAIVSLVTGILSILCCSSIFVVGLAAIVTGFMAKSKADNNASEFGGKGLAWAGMITGGVSLLLGAVYWVLILTGAIRFPNF